MRMSLVTFHVAIFPTLSVNYSAPIENILLCYRGKVLSNNWLSSGPVLVRLCQRQIPRVAWGLREINMVHVNFLLKKLNFIVFLLVLKEY